jgi:SAM-dependent methyltransferase
MTKIVDVGGGKGSRYAKDFINEYLPDMQDLEFVRLDADPGTDPDILQDITRPIPKKHCGKYEVVYASHVIEHIAFWDSLAVVNNLLSLLRIGGYILIIVPNLEWACKQVLAGMCDLSVMAVLWGGQDNEWMYHKSGYTKTALSVMAKRLELTLMQLKSTPLYVFINEKETVASQHVMLARKDKENQPLRIEIKPRERIPIVL